MDWSCSSCPTSSTQLIKLIEMVEKSSIKLAMDPLLFTAGTYRNHSCSYDDLCEIYAGMVLGGLEHFVH